MLRMNKSCPNWMKLVQNWIKYFQIGQNLHKVDKTFTTWIRLKGKKGNFGTFQSTQSKD